MVRDNIFERTRPMAFKSGSLEITGNYFDPGCGDYSVGGYSRMLDFGNPTHNGNHIAEAVLHNIYIGDNVNATDPWRRLLWVDDYDYEGETKFVAYNLYVDGTETAWEADGRDRIHLETRSRGSHSATWDASDRASGVYLCRLTGADQVSRMQKMVLIK